MVYLVTVKPINFLLCFVMIQIVGMNFAWGYPSPHFADLLKLPNTKGTFLLPSLPKHLTQKPKQSPKATCLDQFGQEISSDESGYIRCMQELSMRNPQKYENPDDTRKKINYSFKF